MDQGGQIAGRRQHRPVVVVTIEIGKVRSILQFGGALCKENLGEFRREYVGGCEAGCFGVSRLHGREFFPRVITISRKKRTG